MEVVPEFKACESCARSKRKCGKESPQCHRCASRSLECIYPLPARPSSFVRLQEAPVSAATPASMPAKEAGRPLELELDTWDPNMLLAFAPAATLARPSAVLTNNTPAKELSADWFMSPESWRNDHHLSQYKDPAPPSHYSRIALKTFLTTGQRWLSDWISTGGTTFIHKELYSFRLPRCVQDAYTAVALYLLRTEENEDMVHRIIEDRSAQLIRDEEKRATSSSLNPFGHLSRVHALLAYQIICLLDGDIRLRGLAEERTPVMMAWLKQMLDSVWFASQLTPSGAAGAVTAARGLGLGIVETMYEPSSSSSSSSSPTPTTTTTTTPGATPTAAGTCTNPSSHSQEDVLWHTWIFAESARRTWTFSKGLHTIYEVILKGWTMCSGALMLTTASGVWDAPSSYSWSKLCVERGVGLRTPHEVENFLSEARPQDVDEFTKCLLQVLFGKAKMERWMDAEA